eukprot:gene12079-25322_t
MLAKGSYFLTILGTFFYFLPIFLHLDLETEGYGDNDMIPMKMAIAGRPFQFCIIASIASTVPILFDFMVDSFSSSTRKLHPAKTAIWILLLSSIIPNMFIFTYVIHSYEIKYMVIIVTCESSIAIISGAFVLNAYGPRGNAINIDSDSDILIIFFSLHSIFIILVTVLNGRYIRAVLELAHANHEAEMKHKHIEDNVELVNELQGSIESAVDILNDLLVYESLEQEKVDMRTQSIPIISFLQTKLKHLATQARQKNISILIELPQSPYISLNNGSVCAITSSGKKQRRSSVFRRSSLMEHVNYSLQISVKDCGPGISKEQQETIFQTGLSFTSGVLQAQQGQGLGLWISYRIMKLHKGELSVQSNNEATFTGTGTGSTFFLTMPVSFIKSTPAKSPSNMISRLRRQSQLLLFGHQTSSRGGSSSSLIGGLNLGGLNRGVVSVTPLPITTTISVTPLHVTNNNSGSGGNLDNLDRQLSLAKLKPSTSTSYVINNNNNNNNDNNTTTILLTDQSNPSSTSCEAVAAAAVFTQPLFYDSFFRASTRMRHLATFSFRSRLSIDDVVELHGPSRKIKR